MKNMTKNTNLSRIISAILVIVMIGAMATVAAAAYPKADEFVADEAGVLSESTIRQIKKTNKDLDDAVGAIIAVCTVKTTDGVDIAEYARGLFTEWKMGEGVLLLIAAEDKNYYIVQSTGIDDSITNDDLTAIRDGYLEEDFAAGNIDGGVIKTVSKLATELESGLEDAPQSGGEGDEDTEDGEEEKKGTTFGTVLVTILKVILYIALFALAAFVILFVVAMFNDDAAALLQKYVFRRGKSNPAVNQSYYDERLYGNRRSNGQQQRPQQRPSQPRQPGQRPQQQRPANRQYNGQQQRRPDPNQMYNADGTPRRPRQNQNSGNRGGNYNDYNDYGY